MIELPVTFKMLSDLQSGTIDVVRADACKAYGDQRAAEAREQMRDECLSLVGICQILRLTQFAWLTQRIKELK